jgi:hypothetical protein
MAQKLTTIPSGNAVLDRIQDHHRAVLNPLLSLPILSNDPKPLATDLPSLLKALEALGLIRTS